MIQRTKHWIEEREGHGINHGRGEVGVVRHGGSGSKSGTPGDAAKRYISIGLSRDSITFSHVGIATASVSRRALASAVVPAIVWISGRCIAAFEAVGLNVSRNMLFSMAPCIAERP